MSTFEEKRTSPRADLNKGYKCNEPVGLEIDVHDINSDYVTVKCELDPPSNIEFTVTDGVVLECEYEKDIHDGLRLYKVSNFNGYERKKILIKLLANAIE